MPSLRSLRDSLSAGSGKLSRSDFLIVKALNNSRGQDPLSWISERQHGAISRRQAELLGLSESALRHRIRNGGPWQRIYPGVYLAVTGEATADQLDMAALLYAGDDSLLTGVAALRRLGLRQSDRRLTDILIPAPRKHPDRGYLRIHRTTRMPDRFFVQGEIRFTMIPRALADAALFETSMREQRALVANVIQQRRCTPEMLAAELGASRLRNAAALRAIMAEVIEGAMSVAEADLMHLIKRSSLPTPLYNPRLYVNGDFLAKPDAWWEDAGVVAEVDSRQWHLSPDAWEQTMRRHDRMGAAGITVLHFSPNQIRNDPGFVVRTIQGALGAGRPLPWIKTVP